MTNVESGNGFDEVAKELTPEQLKNLSTIEIEVTGNFDEVLNQFNENHGLKLQPRSEGYHITIINPTESKVLSSLNPDQIEALQRINEDIQHGMGVTVEGVGFIDGMQREDLRSTDKTKKALFLSLSMPALQEFRSSLGLSHKDFHLTLGVENSDIHMHIVGKDEKQKDILKPIPKTANPAYTEYTGKLQGLNFGPLSGKENEKPKN